MPESFKFEASANYSPGWGSSQVSQRWSSKMPTVKFCARKNALWLQN